MMSSSSSPSPSSNRDRGEESIMQQRQRPPAPQPQQDFNFESRPNVLPRYTDHAYQDYSTYIEDGGRLQKHKKSERNFPARLHAMLSDEQHSHIISWMPHGRAFKVLDKKLLVEEAIPKYFGQSKYPSFTRQLSGWGFKRFQKMGPDFGCYYHECFLRGHPRLTILMRRIPSGQGKSTPNTHEEPDLYVIAEQYPLDKSADVARKSAAAPDMESLSNHQWDPYQHYSTLPPQPQPQLDAPYGDAVNWYEGNNLVNQPTTSVGQYHHSFASAGADTGAAKKEGDDGQTTKSSAQDVMNYGPLPISNHHFDAPYAAATVNWYEGNNLVNRFTTSVGQYHYSFASAGADTGAAKKEGDDDQTTKSSGQDMMKNYDPFPVSNHHFDAPHTAAAAAVNWYEGNTVNQFTTSVGQYHSFASAAAGTGAAKKEGDDHQTTKPSGQDMMKNYDPFPMSNHHLDSHRGHSSMHPPHQGADTNQYSDGSNINQYAAGSSHQDVAAARYYHSQPQYSQQHEAHNGNNMLNHNYGYSNPYYNFSDNYSAHGLVEGHSQHSQPSGSRSSAVAAQLNHPAQGFHDHNYNSSFPSFSPLKSSFQEDDEESESEGAAKDSKTRS